MSPKVKGLDKTICIVQEGWIKDDGDVFAGLAKLGAVKKSEEFFLLLWPHERVQRTDPSFGHPPPHHSGEIHSDV